jgi:hypothetical protein
MLGRNRRELKCLLEAARGRRGTLCAREILTLSWNRSRTWRPLMLENEPQPKNVNGAAGDAVPAAT